jgi:hypothetical protein
VGVLGLLQQLGELFARDIHRVLLVGSRSC